ncbi:hypothetical protein GBAR_LOCUS23052, partial [Geodia barretti]
MDTRGRAAEETKNIVYLERLVEEFTHWQESTAEVVEENARLHTEISGQQKLNGLQKQELAASNAETAQLRQTVASLHRILSKRWDMEEENGQLKERILFTQSAAEQLEE